MALAGKCFTMKNGIFFLFVVVSWVAYLPAVAQRRAPNINIGLQLAQPLGEFATQYDGFPAGLGGTFSMPVSRSPIEWGVGFAWNNMGSSDRDIIALVNQDSINGNTYAEGSMAIRSTNNRYLVHGRVRPFTGRIQPYGDLFAGLETYKTTTSITLDNSGYSAELSTNRDHLDLTYSVGWALGLRWRIAPSIFAEARYERITGGRVQYVDEESININTDNSIAFDLRESNTNRAVYQVGLAIGF